MSDIKDDDEAYLVVDQAHMKNVVLPEVVWAKIGDDGQLETIRWDIISMYAAEYDGSDKNRSQTHVICKLLVLVRDETRKQYEQL